MLSESLHLTRQWISFHPLCALSELCGCLSFETIRITRRSPCDLLSNSTPIDHARASSGSISFFPHGGTEIDSEPPMNRSSHTILHPFSIRIQNPSSCISVAPCLREILFLGRTSGVTRRRPSDLPFQSRPDPPLGCTPWFGVTAAHTRRPPNARAPAFLVVARADQRG